MEPMYYLGLDVHKRKISYCVKDSSGKVFAEGLLPATRLDLDLWMKTLPQPWSAAMEATMFTGWIYDRLKPHAAALKLWVRFVSFPSFHQPVGAPLESRCFPTENTLYLFFLPTVTRFFLPQRQGYTLPHRFPIASEPFSAPINSFNLFSFTFLRTLLRHGFLQLLSFQLLPHSFYRYGGGYPYQRTHLATGTMYPAPTLAKRMTRQRFPDARSMISIGICDRMRGSIVWRGLNSWRIEKPTRPNHTAAHCNPHITTGEWRTESVQRSWPSENSPSANRPSPFAFARVRYGRG